MALLKCCWDCSVPRLERGLGRLCQRWTASGQHSGVTWTKGCPHHVAGFSLVRSACRSGPHCPSKGKGMNSSFGNTPVALGGLGRRHFPLSPLAFPLILLCSGCLWAEQLSYPTDVRRCQLSACDARKLCVQVHSLGSSGNE